MNELFRRFLFLLQGRRLNSELEEEIRDHLDRKTADGTTADEARRQFGNVTRIMEDSREVWTWTWFEQLVKDVRYAARTMKANGVFTATAVISLALGIGANTAIYSFMDAILVRSLPVRHPEQLVILNWKAKKEPPLVNSHWGDSYDMPGGGMASPNFPYPVLTVLSDNNSVLTTLFGYVEAGHLNFVANDQASIVNSECVTGGFFSGLGVPPALGRVIGPDDDRPAAPVVVMLAFDYWQSRFGADPAVIGKAAKINGSPVTIVGVAAPEFYGVEPRMKADVFIPMAHQATLRQQQDGRQMFEDGHYYWIELMGRLKPGVSLRAAEGQLSGVFHHYVEGTATNDRERADLPSLWLQPGGSGVDGIRRRFSKPLWVLMAMVCLILVIACANVATLQSARAASRRREMAVRLGLGAGRFRLIRQLLTENILLGLTGGVAGLGVGAAGIRLLSPMISNGDEGFSVRVGIDWRVLGFTLLVSVVAGIVFGLAPAFESTRVDLTPALKGTRSIEYYAGHRRRTLRFGLGHLLVTAQIAISMLLVVTAGLFLHTLVNLHSVQLGFNAEHILLFNIDASRAGYKDAGLKSFYSEIQSRLQSLPGVIGATSTDMPMVGGWSSRTGITVPGIPQPPEGQRGPMTAYAKVGTTFFDTMELPIIAGRPIDKRDVQGASPVAVVNQVFVDKYFPGQNPLGRHFGVGRNNNKIDVEIVGVAKTARYNSLKQEIPPVTYTSWLQAPPIWRLQDMFFEIRTIGDPLQLATSVRQIVREASPLVPVQGITTQKRRIDQTISQELAFAKLSSCFGALALLMACVGLYGTMAYSVARRTNEIGIRMALGAARGTIVWMVLREVAALCTIGALVGFAAVSGGTTLVKSFLFGLQPTDPVTLSLAAGLLIGCALIAGFLPARRASRIDPMAALRHE